MVLEKGSKGSAVASLQEMLNRLHFEGRKSTGPKATYDALGVDGVFGADTEDAVIAFQEFANIYADGRVGPVTLAALERAFSTLQIELNSPIALPTDGKLGIETGPADKYGEGYGRVRLRSDTLAAYRLVYDAVKRQGGILTSSGGIRDLYAEVNPARSATSFHYSGRALDLFIWSGMKAPQTDPYVVQRLGNRRYRVYARCDSSKAQAGALPPSISVPDAVSYTSRKRGVTVTDHLLDLTALFAQHGFKPIRARQNFEDGGPRLGAEWWHFQYEVGMIAGQTTFGSELLKIYSLAKLQPSPPWQYKDYRWQKEWF